MDLPAASRAPPFAAPCTGDRSLYRLLNRAEGYPLPDDSRKEIRSFSAYLQQPAVGKQA